MTTTDPYVLGVRAAWLDWLHGDCRCAVGDGLWAGLPHTEAFWAGYAALYRRPPSRRYHYAWWVSHPAASR